MRYQILGGYRLGEKQKYRDAGLFPYDLRDAEGPEYTIEPNVRVNNIGGIVTDQPIEFDEDSKERMLSKEFFEKYPDAKECNLACGVITGHRYEPVLGFNTKQWWIYDNHNDAYIDPPADVLNEAKDKDDPESFLQEIVDKNPDWLNDKDYIYDAENCEI